MHRSLQIAAFSLVVAGCVTSKNSSNSPKPVLHEKAATVDLQPKAGDVAILEEAPTPSNAEQMKFFLEHQAYDSDFGEDQHKFISALPDSPPEGSLTEAVLLLGLVKSVLHPLNSESSSFEESDLQSEIQASENDEQVEEENAPSTDETNIAENQSSTTEENSEDNNEWTEPVSNTPKGPSLEKMCEERGVNLADGLLENIYLYGYGFARQTFEAIHKGPNSEDWMNEVTSALNQHAIAWSNLAKDMGVIADTSKPDDTLEEDTTPEKAPSIAPNPADLMTGDSIIIEAQRLVDQGKFEEAIKKVETIDDSSPMYNVALDKIKEFSNRAVPSIM